MKNLFKLMFFVLIFTQAGISCSSRKSEPVKQRPFVAETASEKNGEKKFMMHCQKCHPGGEAGLGPAINAAPQLVKRFQVRHGVGVMPSFREDEISAQDLSDILQYLKAWKTY